MLVDTPRAWTGQIPGRTPETAPFWDACNRGEFLLQRCRDCSKVQYHYRAQCCHCWSSDVEDFASSGEGTVWTFSVVYRNNTRHYKDSTPYVVAVVELEGGVKVFGNVLGCDPESVVIGMPVGLSFSKAETGQMIPVFVAANR